MIKCYQAHLHIRSYMTFSMCLNCDCAHQPSEGEKPPLGEALKTLLTGINLMVLVKVYGGFLPAANDDVIGSDCWN